MSKELILFQEEKISNKEKFYILMDLLVTNQGESSLEFYIFFGIFYLQIISSFFSDFVGILNVNDSFSDKILFYIQKIVRIKDIFRNDYENFKITELTLFTIFIILIIHFFGSCYIISRNSFYSYNLSFINLYIKIFLYLAYNIILDLCFSNFCFGIDQFNPNFSNVKCSGHDMALTIISIVFSIAVLILTILILTFYYESFFLSNSYYAKISCKYDYYLFINNFIISILLTQVKYLTKEIFLIYNLVISILFFIFYHKYYLHYNNATQELIGTFHILYVWTSVFGIIFTYVNIQEKGIIYLLVSILACILYVNIQKKLIEKIVLNLPFHKIENQFYLLQYCHYMINKIINSAEDPKIKSFLSGIIHMHLTECPNPSCVLKNKQNIYLPINDKWSDRTIKNTDDEVFLKIFINSVMNYYLVSKNCIADFYLNLSLYYLVMIGNYCESIYLYKKVSDFILTNQEEFTFMRLKFKIAKVLKEKLRPSNEQVVSLEFLDVSQYYKYDSLSQNFVNEISNDIHLSLEFWKTFRAPLKDITKKIDFNKVFKLTDKIRISKKKVEIMWNELLSIYGGVNEFFELYSNYVVEINDDDLKKRDLDSLRRKSDNYNEHLNQNFYGVLFSKDTGIIIANGDKGSEGLIELSNREIENIFKYKPNDIKGKNLANLMPKLFVQDHSKYMQRYFKIGEKRKIDNNDFHSFGKDKNNNIIKLKLAIKLFPILNENVFYVGLILKENVDDIIFMDNRFNIQGMSSSLMKRFGITNNLLFQENEIPFYVICKKFVNFYSIFLHSTKKGDDDDDLIDSNAEKNENNDKDENDEYKTEEKKNENIHENIEINENIELEYEIKFPNFLTEYSEKTKKKNFKPINKLKTILGEEPDDNDNMLENEDDPLIDDSKSKSKFTSNLRSSILFGSVINHQKDINLTKNEATKNSYGETPTPTPTPDGSTPTPDYNKKDKILLNKQNEDKNKYNKIIKKYINLFESCHFSELEDLIDNYNSNAQLEYKFNFTFDRYNYGNNQVAYIVRCIDNKNDAGKSEEETINEIDQKGVRYKKEKIEHIKPLYELYPSEKSELKEQTDNFLKLSLENHRLQKALEACKKDIKEMSIAYGQKEDIIVKDENSSQISQSGFDSGLVKKNRIEEIKSNLLVNISSFYSLKYIKIIIILVGIFTFVFGFIYIYVFIELHKILKNVSLINIQLFQNCLWTTEIVSIFISLKTLNINYKNQNKNFRFNNYKEKETDTNLEYYNRMKEFATTLYYNILSSNKALEMDISKYLNKSILMDLYWERIQISYVKDKYSVYLNQIDTESFPMAMAQLLSNCISYLKNDIFNITEEALKNYNNLKSKDKEEIDIYSEHILFIIIENSYDNILPNHFKKIANIPEILKKYNEAKKSTAIIIIITYGCAMIILCIFYSFLLYITNKSLTGGLEKVTKIRLEQVEETIKIIETFNSNLKKIRDKESKDEDEKENNVVKDNQNNQNNLTKNSTNNENVNDNSNDKRKKNSSETSSIVGSNGFNTDIKKYIPLKVLDYSFFYIIYIFCVLCAFLIPIYIYTNQIVNNTNHLLVVENYIFGLLIESSAETVDIKCFMSNCQNKTQLEYSHIANTELMLSVIEGMNSFQKVSEFYNLNFLANACGTVISNETSPDKYKECMDDNLIISANSTDSLIRLINDIVENIKTEYNIRKELKAENQNIEEVKLSLFETDYFQLMEKAFYKYILPVGNNFAEIVTIDLNNYLNGNKTLIILLILLLFILMIIYCLFLGITLIKQLIHYLSVSRCIMKIIPTSVIINTQELENWIENKYSF